MGRLTLPPIDNTRAFRDAVERALNNLSDQTNADPTSTSSGTPPQISGINVVEKGGIHDIQITDETPAQRGLNYFAEYSRTPDMANAHKIDLGSSQNHRANLGAGKYYWQGYSSYGTSSHSTPVVHGGASPQGVGTGEHDGPDMQPRQGGMGYGPIYRNSPTIPVRR